MPTLHATHDEFMAMGSALRWWLGYMPRPDGRDAVPVDEKRHSRALLAWMLHGISDEEMHDEQERYDRWKSRNGTVEAA